MDDSPTATFFTPLKRLIVALIVTIWSVKTFWSWEIDNIVSYLNFRNNVHGWFAIQQDIIIAKFFIDWKNFYFHRRFLCLVSTKLFTSVHCKAHCPLTTRFWYQSHVEIIPFFNWWNISHVIPIQFLNVYKKLIDNLVRTKCTKNQLHLKRN